MKSIFISFIFIVGFFKTSVGFEQNIRVFNDNTLDFPITYTQSKLVTFEDGKDTLFINRSSEDHPISYFREIATGVCLDNECRPLNIIVYWTITGRFLGFELPEGEFLSKTDHEKFNEKEYQDMNRMVSNQNSILANFSIKDLTVPVTDADTAGEKIDGVSAATKASILDYCVEGAVYTTYTLWHIIYGETRTKIIEITESMLSPELLTMIMDSQNILDKKWGLTHARKFWQSSEIQQQIFDIIENQDLQLIDMAMNVIPISSLESSDLQIRLYSYYHQSDNTVKRKILKKFQMVTHLSDSIKYQFIKNFDSDNRLAEDVLDLLMDENMMVAYKTYNYLREQNTKDRHVQKMMKKYLRK